MLALRREFESLESVCRAIRDEQVGFPGGEGDARMRQDGVAENPGEVPAAPEGCRDGFPGDHLVHYDTEERTRAPRFWRGELRLRVSGRKAVHLAHELFGAA